ncbi:MAG: hypothetical protein DRJ37_03095 [Thermoprotei archaeon]|nr:MAG: hypothetical protein DRJ37_03095 [Thermoprotei archaeon]
MIIVRFYGYYREALNIEKMEIGRAETLRDVLEKLRELLGEKSNILFERGRLKKELLLAVNSTIVKSDDVEGKKIFDGDIISIMPLPSGG